MITDRTQADVTNKTDKGYYNATDLNRVEAKVSELAELFEGVGYIVNPVTKLDWVMSDIPRSSDLERYFSNIATLRDILTMQDSTPEPPMMDGGAYAWSPMTYTLANNAEQILVDISDSLNRMADTQFYANEIFAGEV